MIRQIRVEELPDISRGCSVLGAGGGGEAYTATLMAMQAIEDFGPVELVTFDDLPDDAWSCPAASWARPP